MHKKDNTQMCFKDFIQAQAQAANAKTQPLIGLESPKICRGIKPKKIT